MNKDNPCHTDVGDDLSVIVLGASGDLARKKVVPALFVLFAQDRLPRNFRLFGFARTPFSAEAFRASLNEFVTCRAAAGSACEAKRREFLSRCFYVAGDYASPDSFLDLFSAMRENEPGPSPNRIFYMATPPSVFRHAARALGDSGLVRCEQAQPWTRAVIEKPFGRDRSSSDTLAADLASVFDERQIYRIDHYLGKEAVLNLMVLRFANRVFDPIWNRTHIESVLIDWAEDIGIAGRGGYYDRYGILRDVVQNHLLQTLALIAMERPAAPGAAATRQAKLDVLQAMAPPGLQDLRIGQYGPGIGRGQAQPGYRQETGVPATSRTPTYAAVRLTVNNSRWSGVPFLIRAGKALNRRVTEVRIRLRPIMGDNLFDALSVGALPRNELVMRIQPDEAIRLHIVAKQPGLNAALTQRDLNLIYSAAFAESIPDAYERLLLDVVQGEKSLFIHADELAAAWDVFTPVLTAIETDEIMPFVYPFGSDADSLDTPE